MNSKIKLLIVADTYYPKVDGTLRFIEEFVKRARNEFDISLLVPNLGKSTKPKGVKNVTLIAPSKIVKLSGYPNMKISIKNICDIKKAVKETDFVFVQGPALISYLSIYYGKKYKKKIIFYKHHITWELYENFFPEISKKFLIRIVRKLAIIFYNKCDLIIIPYRELEDSLKQYGVKSEIRVGSLGIDIDQFSISKNKKASKKKLKLPLNKTIIGYVGRISKEKNIDILLEAFNKVEFKDIFLLIVGGGNPDLVKKLKEIRNCHVTGFVNNVQDYLKATDIFVMPSLTETTSLATLEAMSCGLPVIATKVGFIKNYLVKDHNGIFFPRNSSTMLALKIEQLIKDPELMKTLGNNARKMVAYSFSWDRSVNKIKRILLE